MRDRLRTVELSRFWTLRNAFFSLKQRLKFSTDGAWATFEIPPEYDALLEREDLYASWIVRNDPTSAELVRQRQAAANFAFRPTVAVVVVDEDGHATEAQYERTLRSLRAQTYARVQIIRPGDPFAEADFIGFARVGDALAAHALYACVLALAATPDADVVYTDQDEIDAEGRRIRPWFKPDYGVESLLSRPYFGDLTLYRRSILEAMPAAADGGNAYDRVLRATELARNVVHVPEIAYHRFGSLSQANGDDIRAVEAALVRRGESGSVARERADAPLIVRYGLRRPGRVSIVLPTRDHGDDVDRALTSLFERTTYADFELLLVDNGSRDARALDVFDTWRKRDSRVRILRYDIAFNYSVLNNRAAREATGPYLLLLNNDTEIQTPDWLEAMLEQAQRPAIGAVGANLRFPDGNVQHAGVVLGLGGVAGHPHRLESDGGDGYFGSLSAISNVSAVTGACLMVRAAAFAEVGGLDEELTVAFNDIDFCLKLMARGYRNVWLPHVVLTHFESLSRGHDVGLSKGRRALREREIMLERWPDLIANDPHYSPHLTRRDESVAIRVEEDL